MKCNVHKIWRKKYEIQQLKKELAEEREKVAALQQQQTVKLDEKQVQDFLDELSDRIDRITYENKTRVVITDKTKMDGFSYIFKLFIGTSFVFFSFMITFVLIKMWGYFWDNGWTGIAALGFVAMADIDCFILGVGIFKEKDRNFIIALFSALVALAALIVALVK